MFMGAAAFNSDLSPCNVQAGEVGCVDVKSDADLHSHPGHRPISNQSRWREQRHDSAAAELLGDRDRSEDEVSERQSRADDSGRRSRALTLVSPSAQAQT